MTSLTLRQPDDFHIHLRDGLALHTTVAHTAQQFARVTCMPNLTPPVVNANDAMAYRERIMAHAQQYPHFNPIMALYLTPSTTPDMIYAAAQHPFIKAVKLYPAGATTNSHAGVAHIAQLYPVLKALEETGLLFLVHGEVTDADIDIFDRERVFIERILSPIAHDFPALKIVLEHITTQQATTFVTQAGANIAATITPQHLLYNRNHMLVGGIKPHFYCLPILKRRNHQEALLEAATSGNPKFFLGTDSAPHAKHTKEAACGCAGSYTAPIAMSLYATAFEQVGALDRLENFSSVFGAQFYGLPLNTQTITLVQQEQRVVDAYPYLENEALVPLNAGEMLKWTLQ